ncbi:para-aminobenzoate synthase [Piedraia hortae CBS 480.64]|uniref:aminodeoxychorismate synthase n=1 Tax=Piedraia hortae CBS 480.64 TaxID=1314780 RepID=A0A6A7BU48_9PEZI|nr:para-aminobenzoate synthase [Piedraia hortae CBS 480.64]
MPPGRILYIDAYDSFSNNIVALLKDNLPVTVEVIRHDDARFLQDEPAFDEYLTQFDAAVAGPGPGHPANPEDVGLIGQLWQQSRPVLAICLGFQSLVLAHGLQVSQLKAPRHGLVRRITHCKQDLFSSLGEIQATQYHSLHVSLEYPPQYMRGSSAHDLVPLAWDLDDAVNGKILMAIRHRVKPYWGVQFHPESVCSTMGSQLVSSWWHLVCDYNRKVNGDCKFKLQAAPAVHPAARQVSWSSFESSISAAEVVEALHEEVVLLESGLCNGKPVNSETGRYSIVGVHNSNSLQICWSNQKLTLYEDGKVTECHRVQVQDVFVHLERILEQYRALGGIEAIPFWGGLVGYISYEAGLNTIGIQTDNADQPEIWFIMVERSIVLDHMQNKVFVQSCRADDCEWVHNMTQALSSRSSGHKSESSVKPGVIISEPSKAIYFQQVEACQRHLHAGSSYELCLTGQTIVCNDTPSWTLYRDLQQRNPAPFSAYIHLYNNDDKDVTIISSSPERFLSWTRSGRCQFRPIKGTVRKDDNMTKAKAEAILGTVKERAENLMIVDLIRHDLNGVEGVQKVYVPQLMKVEEYSTVYQLVSVIEGDLSAAPSRFAALSRSLPPGSITGAPKKRSCQLLQELEGKQPRGVYSGVLGYLDVGGGADFSVVIRTAARYSPTGPWHIGAGGAITALSFPDAEWAELLTKRCSVLRTFSQQ